MGHRGPHAEGLGHQHRTTLRHSLKFDPSDAETVDGQIAQFLRATREKDLNNKKPSIKFYTKRRTRKKALRPDEWERVSDSLGPTALLSLLYRKRIKANYEDIDTFLHPDLDPESLYGHLLKVVGGLNFVHEVMISKALGFDVFRGFLENLPGSSRSRVESRLSTVSELAA